MGDFSQGLQQLSLQFIPFLVAVVFHEVGHGFVANLWGDPTAKDEGRITLNPLAHVDLLGTVMLPAISMFMGSSLFIGWAKPVPINPTRFRKFRPGLFWTAIAGPGMNFLTAFFFACGLMAMIRFMPQDFYLFEPLVKMARFGVIFNFWIAIFNLLPLPTLDGGRILDSFLPYEASRKFNAMTPYLFWIVLALLFTGALSILAYPAQFLTNATLALAAMLFGIGGFL